MERFNQRVDCLQKALGQAQRDRHRTRRQLVQIDADELPTPPPSSTLDDGNADMSAAEDGMRRAQWSSRALTCSVAAVVNSSQEFPLTPASGKSGNLPR
ncbi:hypothetical protein [Burkholderia oklahomensis]|uniref:hypothetical protein n=1 Tax=Burkholderia oklahomensis TaxID=342113 RepID=UPI0018DBB426|nr:hypothetical protein [Burkholderia oklahomensis]MBI0363873.1 hypothetical protein [Burkholderia oklahomensis]